MLRIQIVPFGGSAHHLLNNPEWLRAMSRRSETIYVSPYYDKKYFRQEIVGPILNEDGYIRSECLGVEYQLDGIDYFFEKSDKEIYERLFKGKNHGLT